VNLKVVKNYLDEYESGGIERLKAVRFCGSVGELMAHEETKEAHFRAYPPAKINKAVATITKLTVMKRSPTEVRLFLKSLRMKRQTTGALPAKADPYKQEAFKKSTRAATSRS
jgi:hypothetical protein